MKTCFLVCQQAKISPPSEQSLSTICHYLTRLQQVDSPLEKLENLLACISTIFNSVSHIIKSRVFSYFTQISLLIGEIVKPEPRRCVAWRGRLLAAVRLGASARRDGGC